MKSIVKIASEAPSQILVQLSKATNIISDVSGIVEEEEEEVGLTRKKKISETVVKSASDLNLTSDIAQVKVQEVKEKYDKSEPVETKAS